MKIARINYPQLAAICAILVLTLVQGTAFTRASPHATTRAVAEPDLSNEVRTLESYANDLVAYQRDCSQLSKKPELRSADLDPLQRKSDDLKRRLSDVQRVIGDVIRKLKAANAWDDLDEKLLAKITDPSVRILFQQSSLRQDLEEATTNLGSHARGIGIPVDNLRRKLTGQTLAPDRGAFIVLAAYRPSAPMKFVSLACTIQKVRVGLINRLGGIPTDSTVPGATMGGTVCPMVN